jgi:hypothetical protein
MRGFSIFWSCRGPFVQGVPEYRERMRSPCGIVLIVALVLAIAHPPSAGAADGPSETTQGATGADESSGFSWGTAATVATAAATIVLVAVTARYVRLTDALVVSAAEDRRLGVQPTLVLRAPEVDSPGHRPVFVSLENIGNGLAHEMSVEIGFLRRESEAASPAISVVDDSIAAGGRMWFAAPASGLHAGPMSVAEIQTSFDVMYAEGHVVDLARERHAVQIRIPVAAMRTAILREPPTGYLPSPV